MEFIEAKHIINPTSNSSWFGLDYNMNIYKGCCHGCIYCDSRSNCYNIIDFDKVRAKKDSSIIIENELRKKIKKGVIGTGAMSDPYNPFEKKYELTKNALNLVDKYGFGISIATKSSLIARDKNIIKRISEHSPTLIKITITTYNDNMSKKVEPNVCPSSERFKAIKELSKEGIFTGILLMPVLPFLEDSKENVLNVVKLAHENGAKFIYPSFGMTLRNNQREWYFNKLDSLYPNLKAKYIKEYGFSYECRSIYWKELYSLFSEECTKYGILYKMKDIITAYKSPYKNEQLTLF